MAKGIPASWLEVLPEPLIESITAFELVQQGRAQTCFLTLNHDIAIFVKQSDECLIRSEVNTLRFLAQQSEFTDFSYPELINFESNCLFTKKVQGTPLVDALDFVIQDQSLAGALVELHNIDVTHFSAEGDTFVLPNIEELNNALKLFDVDSNKAQRLLGKMSEACTQIQSSKPCSGFIHGDLTPDNILRFGDKPTFLDWEFASVRDVRWDLATICEEFNLTSAQINQFVKNYMALKLETESDFKQGLKHWRFIYLATCFIWSVEQTYKSAEYLAKLERQLE